MFTPFPSALETFFRSIAVAWHLVAEHEGWYVFLWVYVRLRPLFTFRHRAPSRPLAIYSIPSGRFKSTLHRSIPSSPRAHTPVWSACTHRSWFPVTVATIQVGEADTESSPGIRVPRARKLRQVTATWKPRALTQLPLSVQIQVCYAHRVSPLAGVFALRQRFQAEAFVLSTVVVGSCPRHVEKRSPGPVTQSSKFQEMFCFYTNL